jgi:hypothetical protein
VHVSPRHSELTGNHTSVLRTEAHVMCHVHGVPCGARRDASQINHSSAHGGSSTARVWEETSCAYRPTKSSVTPHDDDVYAAYSQHWHVTTGLLTYIIIHHEQMRTTCGPSPPLPRPPAAPPPPPPPPIIIMRLEVALAAVPRNATIAGACGLRAPPLPLPLPLSPPLPFSPPSGLAAGRSGSLSCGSGFTTASFAGILGANLVLLPAGR